VSGKKQIPAKKTGTSGGGTGFGASGEEKQVSKDAMKVVRKTEQALGKTVNVVYGAHDIDMELEGLTINEIQLALKDLLNIDQENVEAYVDGNLISAEDKASVKIQAGQRLEFMKEAGRKG
jgi:hypothetical protein